MDYKQEYEEALERAKVINPGTADYEVVVKIFPELKESEDERIRKALIQHIKDKVSVISGWRKEELIAWLEKQGEQIDIVNKEYWRGYREGKQEILDKYADLEKQGEQMPVENVNGAAYGIDGLWHAITILEETLGKVEGYQSDDGILEHKCAITAVRDLAKKQREQKYVEWSEEDEKMLKSVISSIRISRSSCEEDDDVRDLFDNEIDWLKSLKERYTWKPSDGQMEALWNAIPHIPNSEKDVDTITELPRACGTLYKEAADAV